MLVEAEYEALLQVSLEMDWRFHVALVLAHETGHRIGAIRQLQWSDVDLEGGVVRWRAEHDKSGYEHRTPVTAEVLAALEEARKRNPGIGDAPVLPSPWDRSRCVSCSWTQRWWEKAVALAGLESKRGRGWHSLRRKFALRPHGPAAQGALRTRRLEGGQDGAALLPAGRRGTAQEGAREPSQSSRLRPISGNQSAGIRSEMPVSSITPSRCEPVGFCPLGPPYLAPPRRRQHQELERQTDGWLCFRCSCRLDRRCHLAMRQRPQVLHDVMLGA